MVAIRLLRERDIDFVHEATQREQWGYTRRDIERSLEYEPTGCFVAEHTKQKVGQVFTISYGELGWIGLLIVTPEHRGKGIGTRLMKKATNYLKEKGTKTIGLDAAEKAVPLYERFGFRKAYDSLRFQKQQTLNKQQEPPTQNVFPLKKGDFKAVTRFDQRFFGANRTRVLQGVYKDFEDQCWVAKRNHRVLGYIMNRKDGNVCRIGPWVCLPKHVETAKALLETCISALKAESLDIRIGVSATNFDAMELVESLGFKPNPKSVRMFTGEQSQVGDVLGVYGIAAPELG